MTQTVSGRAPSGTGFPYVLMYHSVAVYGSDPYRVTVDPRRFVRQLRWMRRSGLRGVSMRELLRARQSGRDRGLVGLTFDDGYADLIHNVQPVLAEHGFTATVFVIAGRIGGTNVWDPDGPRKQLMTAAEVREVADAGLEIGSHGLLHRHLTEVGDHELLAETNESRELLRELTGQDVGGFCYPYGDVDDRVMGLTEEAGYDYACAIWRSPLSGPHALPRTYVGDTDGTLRMHAKRLRHELTVRRYRARQGHASPSLVRIR